MRRKIDAILDRWAQEGDARPLLVRGARRVGKTYAIRRLGEEAFGGDFAYCDFQANLERLEAVFAGSTDVARIVADLELLLRRDIVPGRTLIAFDEVQLCEKALNALRFFAGSGYRVIATGSQLGLTLRHRELPFPSDVTHVYLRPLDFEEFLWARGEERMAAAIRRTFDERAPFAFHEEALDLYRRYLVVGGMPAPARAFCEGGGLEEVRALQAEIAQTYVADMALYAPAEETARIRAVWASLPAQLTRESTAKFKYADVASGGRERQLRGPLAWLEAAELVLLNPQTNDAQPPLTARGGGSFFKAYLLDAGILFYRLNLDGGIFLDASLRVSLSPWFRGALAENYVMESLVANGVPTFYWTPGTSSSGEVEFVVQTRRGAIVPIEVKSGPNVRSRSLNAYRAKCGAEVAVRLSERNFGLEGGILSIPLYAAFCLDEAALAAL